MISVSGPKKYEIDHRFEPLMAKVIPNTQMFQVIDVDGDQMKLRATLRKAIYSTVSY